MIIYALKSFLWHQKSIISYAPAFRKPKKCNCLVFTAIFIFYNLRMSQTLWNYPKINKRSICLHSPITKKLLINKIKITHISGILKKKSSPKSLSADCWPTNTQQLANRPPKVCQQSANRVSGELFFRITKENNHTLQVAKKFNFTLLFSKIQ